MCHVLIIEDDFLIASDLADIAMSAGATSVEIAASPTEAFERVVACLPAVIFSDVQIVGGTGPEAVSAIRRQFGLIPVIFITGNPEGCENMEAIAVLTKPAIRQELVAAFQAVAPG